MIDSKRALHGLDRQLLVGLLSALLYDIHEAICIAYHIVRFLFLIHVKTY